MKTLTRKQRKTERKRGTVAQQLQGRHLSGSEYAIWVNQGSDRKKNTSASQRGNPRWRRKLRKGK